jgi:hypothetical protein
MMTHTQIVTNRILDKIKTDEVETLGNLAAACELYAQDWNNTLGERYDLLARADRYRDLQMTALMNS